MIIFWLIIIAAIVYVLLTTPLNQLGGLWQSLGLSNLGESVNMDDGMIMLISFIIFVVFAIASPKKDGRFSSGFVDNRGPGCIIRLIGLGALIVFVIYALDWNALF